MRRIFGSWIVIALLLLIGICGICLVGPRVAEVNRTYDLSPIWSPQSDVIAYVCYRPLIQAILPAQSYHGEIPVDPRFFEICTVNAEGTERVVLTRNEAEESEPTWSPNGREIAFISYRDGGPRLYRMRADGQEQQRLSDACCVRHPEWSPRGDKIAFASNGIVVLDLVSGIEKTILEDGADGVVSEFPTWAPDSLKMAYLERRGDKCEIHIIDSTSGQALVPPHPSQCERPAWTPDSHSLIFVGADSALEEGSSIKLLDLTSGEIRSLTTQKDKIWSGLVRTSTDLYYIAGGNLFQASLRGGQPSEVGTLQGSVLDVGGTPISISPDGQHITFARSESIPRIDAASVWRIDVDGTELIDLSR